MLAKNKVISKQYGKNNNRNGGKSIYVKFYFWKMMYTYKSMFYRKVKNCTVLKSKLSTSGIICDEVYKIMMSICTKY